MHFNVNASPLDIQQAEPANIWNGGVTKICHNANYNWA